MNRTSSRPCRHRRFLPHTLVSHAVYSMLWLVKGQVPDSYRGYLEGDW